METAMGLAKVLHEYAKLRSWVLTADPIATLSFTYHLSEKGPDTYLPSGGLISICGIRQGDRT